MAAWRRLVEDRPAYARVLAPTSASGETASLLDALIRDFDEHERGRIVDACIRVVCQTNIE